MNINRYLGRLALVALPAIASGQIGAARADPSVADGGYLELTKRATFNADYFFVYQDADSGFNHGFPSGFLGSQPPLFTINPACIDDPSSSTGCSTDPNSLDEQHRTVFQIIFQPQPTGTFSGLDFQEPLSGNGNGYNVTGATRIIFQARSPSPNGIRVQFGVGGGTTQFMTIPESSSYAQGCIALPGQPPSVCADSTYQFQQTTSFNFNSVNILFTVLTNDVNARNGGVLLLDNIQYDPAPPMPEPAPFSLPLSTQTFGVMPAALPQNALPDQVNRNVAATYEASIAALALFARGQPADLTNAMAIADSLVYALQHDNAGDPLPVAPNAAGLHNAYESGPLALLNSQGTGAGQAGQVRLAGFSITDPSCNPDIPSTCACGPRKFCLVLDGATGGNNAFAILALVKAYQESGEQRQDYLNAAGLIGNWIGELLLDQSGTGSGGYFLGYPDMGAQKILIPSKSTENNADLFAAYTALAAADPAHASIWRARAKIAGDFVVKMFDKKLGCFNAGTVPAGTSPSGRRRGNDVINQSQFLDADSFTYLAMAMSSRYAKRPFWPRVVDCLGRFQASATADGIPFSGYGLVPSAQSTGVTWEFTGQAGVVTEASGGDATAILTALQLAQTQAPFGDSLGIVDATLPNGDTLQPSQQCLSTPFQCIPERVGIAATTWGIFAAMQINPLQ